MKKKICLALVMTVATILLVGCSSTKSLKEENNAIIAQYIAGSVLKYDTNYKDGLVYAYQRPTEKDKSDAVVVSSQETETTSNNTNDDVKEADSTTTTSVEKAEEKVEYCSLSEVFGKKNIKINYKSYATAQSYSGAYSDEAFSVEAKSGNQLIILEFKLKNEGSKKQSLNFIRSGISYELQTDKEVYYPILSIVSNDLQYFSTSIEAGKTKSAVLIFEVPKKVDVKYSTLTITNKDKVCQQTIK